MKVWKIPTRAESAEQARHATLGAHWRPKVSWVQDTLEELLKQVEQRRVRAEENPRLYADKIDEYEQIERRLHEMVDLEENRALALIEALELLGDARLTDPERACALWVEGDQWVVFGAET